MSRSEPRKKRFWQVDPALFQTRKRGRRERFVLKALTLLKALGKSIGFLGVITYPLTTTLVGIAFGGLAYWGVLLGSVALFGLVIAKFGYARNFDNKDIRLGRMLVGTSLGFLIAAGFVLGLFALKAWLIPVIFGFLSLGVLYMLTRKDQ